jgi:flagellar basal-body rod protein FlgC
MSLFSVMNVAGSALAAQTLRLNTTASNLANAQSVSSTPEGAYKAMRPIFKTTYPLDQAGQGVSTVQTDGIYRSKLAPEKRYSPQHPQADEQGYISAAAVDPQDEMIDMLEASRQYQHNIEVLSTAKSLILKTLNVGK